MKECKKKTLPLLIGFGMGCCHTCMPLHPCSVSFVRACPHPHSYALYAPAFALVHLRLHSFARVCAHVCACVHARLYAPVYVLVRTYLRSFATICTRLRLCPFASACARARSYVPGFAGTHARLVCPCQLLPLFVRAALVHT